MKKLYSIALLLVTFNIYGQDALQATFKGRYSSGYYNSDGGVMEISAYDPASKKLFTINGNSKNIEVINLSDPAAPVKLSDIVVSGYGAAANSVAVKNGVLAAAIEATVKQDNGSVVFFNASTSAHLKTVTVGALPDMLTFTPNGTKVVVANEGEPSADYTNDPEGSISVIDISTGVANATETRINFNAYNGLENLLRADGVRIFGPGATTSKDMEPEYITVSDDSKTAWVVCQENNAMVIVNLTNNTILDIKPLGYKNHNIAGNGLDASDRYLTNPSSAINITTWPVRGLYLPDGIAKMRYNGKTYILTANEGDSRDYAGYAEELRIGSGSYILDPTIFPNAATLKQTGNLGRLKATSSLGDIDNDGDYDAIYTFGTRSFSIWDSSMVRVYDSGDGIEQYIKAINPTHFNANHNSDNIMSGRSDDKGPEPESVVTAQIGDSVYAFVGLERISAVMVYNVTNPFSPTLVQYLSTRNFSEIPVSTEGTGTGTGGDLGPEGLLFISKEESPTGKDLLVISFEVSGTIVIYELTPPVITDVFASVENEIKAFDVYPNPVNDEELNLTRVASVEIFNAQGVMVQKQENTKKVSVENLSKGFYFIKSEAGEIVKFIKE